tara:strand:- start:141 stop:509 length:369 start_codon:yes stop_codon:yes gene_type:complete
MANPNIVNVSNIYGVTTTIYNINFGQYEAFVTNSVNSGKIYKINTILFCNRDNSNSRQIFCDLQDTNSNIISTLIHGVNLPPRSNFILTSKSAMIYVPEDRVLKTRATGNSVSVICSYEEIS